MFVRTLHKRSLHTLFTALGVSGIATLLLVYPAAAATGISRGLSVCTTVIIPTLYPFMLLAGWLTDSPLCHRPGRISKAVTRRLFGLPGCCGPAILLSMVGGYPAGSLAVARLQGQGLITASQAKRMTAFCVGGGPGFIISTVGAGLLGSTKAGILLFIAHTTASLTIGILVRPKEAIPEKPPQPASTPRPIARLVSDTCGALLTMCGFVVLAAMTLSLWEAIRSTLIPGKLAGFSAFLAALLEVSCGCIALAGTTPLTPLWLSLCLSWGGLSVHGQVAAACKGQRVLTPAFWGWRLFHGVWSGCLSLLLFRLFPVSASVNGSLSPQLSPFSVSATASFMLLLLSFLAMLCFSEKNTGKTV